jgi:simple sugar transport system ATP-binding protein
VLLVSPELDEIIALSDRIAVMYKGQIVEIVEAAKVNKAYLGLLMAGVKPAEAREAAPTTTGATEVERVF